MEKQDTVSKTCNVFRLKSEQSGVFVHSDVEEIDESLAYTNSLTCTTNECYCVKTYFTVSREGTEV